jgi:gluconate 2-dehydrogenase gamma chain
VDEREQSDGVVGQDDEGRLTRRALIGRGAAVAGGVTLLGASTASAARLLEKASGAASAASAPGALSASELVTLRSVLSELLPSDELGPGAVEAGVDVYIDRALAGSYASSRPVYSTFLPLFDEAAKAMGASSFAGLSSAQRTKLLTAFEAGKPPGVSAAEGASAAGSFQLLLEHMREGMFGDPMYGGNRNRSGWKLIGYPDIVLNPTVKDQEVGSRVSPSGQSAQSFGGRPYNGPPA